MFPTSARFVTRSCRGLIQKGQGRRDSIFRPLRRERPRRSTEPWSRGEKSRASVIPTCPNPIRCLCWTRRAVRPRCWRESARVWPSGTSRWAGRVLAPWWRGITAFTFRTPHRTASVFWTREVIALSPRSAWNLPRAWAACGEFCRSDWRSVPDESRLYIACAGINAIAVFDTRSNTTLGYIPTAWFPARVATSKDGHTLYVANAKGYGAGPNGGPDFQMGPEGDYIGDIMKGTISIIPVRRPNQLASETQRVISNNGFAPAAAPKPRPEGFPIPSAGGPSSRLHHVVFIIKENRTFDEVLGDIRAIAGEEVNGDPSLARWGLDAEVHDDGQPTLEHVRVTPNHHALAERFGLSDNYYVDSDVSVDGHHWLVDSYPNEWVETAWPPAYGDRMHMFYDDAAPGRLSMGATSALTPGRLPGGGFTVGPSGAPSHQLPELRRGAQRRGRRRLQAHGSAPGSQPAHTRTAVREYFANLSDLQHVHPGSVPVRAVQEGV